MFVQTADLLEIETQIPHEKQGLSPYEFVHVKQSIKGVSYPQLRNQGILPEIPKFNNNIYPKANLPDFLKTSKCYMFFGMFMEYIFKVKSIRRNMFDFVTPTQNFDMGDEKELIYTIFNALKVQYPRAHNCVLSDNDYELLCSIIEEFCSTFAQAEIYDAVLFDQELFIDDLMGLPDLVSIDINTMDELDDSQCPYCYSETGCVYDCKSNYVDENTISNDKIYGVFDSHAEHGSVFFSKGDLIVYEMKNSTYFPNMEKESWLQTFAYCAIYQKMGYNVTKAYILLPLNNTYIELNIQGFDFSRYYNFLIERVNEILEIKQKDQINMLMQILGFGPDIEQLLSNIRYGYHIKKEKTVIKSIQNAINQRFPIDLDTEEHKDLVRQKLNIMGLQLFIRSPRSGAGKISENDKKMTKVYIEKYGLKIFCHDVYIVNLANINTKFYISEKEIQDCVQLGFSGMVVHCGKNVNILSQSAALDLMESGLRALMFYATETCPVILETCAGQGTELCHDYSEFVDFYKRFNGSNKIKICVDTCHVFAAGYCPLEFITGLLEHVPNSIVLIHLNGSMGKRGCKKDRHCKLHEGCIDPEIIESIISLCTELRIPMVRE